MTGDDGATEIGKLLDIRTYQPSAAQQRALLVLARQAIAASLNIQPAPLPAKGDPIMSARAGVFVTLRQKTGYREGDPGLLRGCIGHMQADQPLGRIVPDMAVQSAMADPRFRPMKPEELEGVKIDIAILSQMRPVTSKDEIEIGKHGLVLSGDGRRALLLPKSPLLYGWDLEEYLGHLHQKAGLPIGYWPERGELYRFTSFDFGEEG